ncbi:MAG: hypothetical protein M9899_00485 [Bdellovibrionaceae bacterium]|nr:hypothetical protein [Pseudobdellovibrionaceae bacterium]
MEMSNSLSFWKRQIKICMMLAVAFGMVGCQTFDDIGLKTREQVEKEKRVTQPEEGESKPSEVVGEVSQDVDKKLFNIQDENVRPKLGLILGPGMALSLGHLGVLKALNDQKLPIEVIAGVEWSSLIAANYALNGAANDMAWKASQGQLNVGVEKGFLRGEIKETSEDEVAKLIQTYTRGRAISNGKIKFICPALDVSNAKALYFKSGSYGRALQSCMKAPPLTQSEPRVWANLTDIESLAKEMRRMGAEKVILVNALPLGGGLNWGERSSAVSPRDKYFWAQVQRSMVQKPNSVDHILTLNTGGQSVLDFKEKRNLIQQSSTRADQFFRDLARKYSF